MTVVSADSSETKSTGRLLQSEMLHSITKDRTSMFGAAAEASPVPYRHT